MVLRDSIFQNMTHDNWTAALKPKVQGTWNLHKHLPKDMDFFVPISSIASATGARGQANYAAANAYMDALVQYRRERGQRAFVLNLGPVLSVGHVAEQDIEEFLLGEGFEAITLQEMLVLLDIACSDMTSDDPLNTGHIFSGFSGAHSSESKKKGGVYWLQRPMFSQLRNFDAGSNDMTVAESDTKSKKGSASINKLLSGHGENTSIATAVILDALILKLSMVLDTAQDDVDPNKPVHAFGIDSLASLEIRYWLLKEVGADLAIFKIIGAMSLAALSELAWEKSKYHLRQQ